METPFDAYICIRFDFPPRKYLTYKEWKRLNELNHGLKPPVSTLPIRNGNEWSVTSSQSITILSLNVSTLPIRNGNIACLLLSIVTNNLAL